MDNGVRVKGGFGVARPFEGELRESDISGAQLVQIDYERRAEARPGAQQRGEPHECGHPVAPGHGRGDLAIWRRSTSPVRGIQES